MNINSEPEKQATRQANIAKKAARVRGKHGLFPRRYRIPALSGTVFTTVASARTAGIALLKIRKAPEHLRTQFVVTCTDVAVMLVEESLRFKAI